MPDTDNLFYFSNDAGKVSRPPVVFLHGAGGTHLHWPPQARRLLGQRIFAPDLPGHGRSSGAGRQSIGEYARDVERFLVDAGLNSAILVGHSMGSAIALTLALDFPKRVLALCLVGSGARLRVAPQILEGTASEATFPAAVKLVNDFAFGPSTAPRLKELAAQRMAETRPSVLHGDFAACNEFEAMARLGEITVPTLLVCGAEDKLTPVKYSEYLRDHIAGARLVTIPDAGHMVMLEQSEAFSSVLAEFINSIPYRPGQ